MLPLILTIVGIVMCLPACFKKTDVYRKYRKEEKIYLFMFYFGIIVVILGIILAIFDWIR